MSQTENASKDAAALALAFGATQSEAGETAQVSRKTVYRWRQEPDFLRLVADVRRAGLDSAIGKISGRITEAADALTALAVEPHDSGPTRLGAIRLMMETLNDHLVTANLEERLVALEARSMTR